MQKESPVIWLVLFGVLSLIGFFGVVVNASRLRLAKRTQNEMEALTKNLHAPPYNTVATVAVNNPLPAPVLRYQMLAVGDRAPVRTLRIHHGGTFAMGEQSKARPIEGDQLFTSDPPGFVWMGRVDLTLGVWVHARDLSAEGTGGMRVLLDDIFTLVDVKGTPEINQGSVLRLLAEMVWYPTSLFDARYVTWSPVDETHAKATLRVGQVEVHGVFEFGSDGLPTRFDAQRFQDKGKLLPWGGIYRDYRRISGMLVPCEAEVFWQLATGPFTYAHWFVSSMEFDKVAPISLLARAAEPSGIPALAR